MRVLVVVVVMDEVVDELLEVGEENVVDGDAASSRPRTERGLI